MGRATDCLPMVQAAYHLTRPGLRNDKNWFEETKRDLRVDDPIGCAVLKACVARCDDYQLKNPAGEGKRWIPAPLIIDKFRDEGYRAAMNALSDKGGPLAAMYSEIASETCRVKIGGKRMHAALVDPSSHQSLDERIDLKTNFCYVVLSENRVPFVKDAVAFAHFLLTAIEMPLFYKEDAPNYNQVKHFARLSPPDSIDWEGCACPEAIRNYDSEFLDRLNKVYEFLDKYHRGEFEYLNKSTFTPEVRQELFLRFKEAFSPLEGTDVAKEAGKVLAALNKNNLNKFTQEASFFEGKIDLDGSHHRPTGSFFTAEGRLWRTHVPGVHKAVLATIKRFAGIFPIERVEEFVQAMASAIGSVVPKDLGEENMVKY